MMKTKLLSIICILLILQNIQAQTTDSQTNTMYAIAEGDTFASGTTIERPNITLTFGEIGGANFLAAQTLPINDLFKAYTPGNDVNGNKTGGTFYLFAPTKDGILSVGVRQNRVKPLYVEENGTVLSELNGITLDESRSDTYIFSFNVKAGCTYKLYCSGSKLGFYGFIFKWNSNSEQPSTNNFETAAEAVKNMKVGWNLGNTLDAFTTEDWFNPTGWQDYETIWGNPITKPSLMKMMRKAGFNAIRIPVTWFPHMDATGNIDGAWMKRVHEVVDYVIDQGMYCILNSHHDTQHKDAWLWADKSYYEEQERYKYLWTQIAQEFQDYDKHLLFAGWNEILERQEVFGGDSDKERYNVLNQINQDFVDAVRAVGGNNKSRNLIVAPYYNWCGWGKDTPDFIIDALQTLTIPNDEFPGHILFEVHTYFDTSYNKIDEVFEGTIEAIKTYLVPKGAPVVIGEWGPSNEYDNPEQTNAFARHFMQETHSNRIATFAWNGPLCYGEYRNLPVFEEPSYICAMMKGFYGEEYEPQMLSKNDYDEKGQRILFVHTICYEGIWTELNVFSDDIPLKLKNYKGIRIEFAEPVNPEEFQFKFYGDSSDEDLRPVNNGLSTTIDFESLKFKQTINRIALQHTQEGKAEAKVICAWLIRQDGTEEYCDPSPFYGCEIIKKEKCLDSSNPSGDANDDGVVNAADIVEAINAMNGKASVKFKFSNADMNNNGTIDNTDINMIVNIIIRNQ